MELREFEPLTFCMPCMVLETGNCVVAIARFSEHAAAVGNSAWIISAHPARLFKNRRLISQPLRERRR